MMTSGGISSSFSGNVVSAKYLLGPDPSQPLRLGPISVSGNVYATGNYYAQGNVLVTQNVIVSGTVNTNTLVVNSGGGGGGATFDGITISSPAIQSLPTTNTVVLQKGDSQIIVTPNITAAGYQTYMHIADDETGNTLYGRETMSAARDLSDARNYNTFLGVESGKSLAKGSTNVAMGYQALRTSSVTSSNVAIGPYAMDLLMNGGYNIAVGNAAAQGRQSPISTSFINNVCIGTASMGNVLGDNIHHNVVIGESAGYDIGAGAEYNFFGGAMCGYSTTLNRLTGAYNIGIGRNCLRSIEGTAEKNVCIGSYVCESATDAYYNTAVGHEAGKGLTTGTGNVFLGYRTAVDAASSSNNVVIGNSAGGAVVSAAGESNIVIGAYSNITGNSMYGVAIGGSSMSGATNAVAIGSSSFATANNAVAVGESSRASAANSIAIGELANVSGASSVAIGESSIVTVAESVAIGKSISIGTMYSVAIGSSAVVGAEGGVAIGSTASSTGSYTTSIGHSSATSGDYSVSIGSAASSTSTESLSMGTSSKTTADGAIAIGHGTWAAGTKSVAIGYDATTGLTGECAIGHITDNPMFIRETSNTHVYKTNEPTAYPNNTFTITWQDIQHGAVSYGNNTGATAILYFPTKANMANLALACGARYEGATWYMWVMNRAISPTGGPYIKLAVDPGVTGLVYGPYIQGGSCKLIAIRLRDWDCNYDIYGNGEGADS